MSTSKIFHVASTASWLVETVYILPLTFRTLGFSDKKLLEVRDVSLLICTKVCICHKKNLPEGCRHSNQQCIFLDGIEKDEVNSIVHCRALGQEQLFFISRLPINRARLIIIIMCQPAGFWFVLGDLYVGSHLFLLEILLSNKADDDEIN